MIVGPAIAASNPRLAYPASAAGSGIDLNNGLVASWLLSDLTDASGNDNTLTGVSTPTFNTGKLGNAMYLSRASGQYAKIANASAGALVSDAAFTVAGWFYPITSGGFGVQYSIIGTSNADTNYTGGWNVRMGGPFGGYSLAGSIGATTFAVPTVLPLQNMWNFFCLRYTGDVGTVSKLTLINGSGSSNVDQGFASDSSSSNDFNIGVANNTTSKCFDGRIDNVVFVNRYWSDDELTAFYNAGTGLELPV